MPHGFYQVFLFCFVLLFSKEESLSGGFCFSFLSLRGFAVIPHSLLSPRDLCFPHPVDIQALLSHNGERHSDVQKKQKAKKKNTPLGVGHYLRRLHKLCRNSSKTWRTSSLQTHNSTSTCLSDDPSQPVHIKKNTKWLFLKEVYFSKHSDMHNAAVICFVYYFFKLCFPNDLVKCCACLSILWSSTTTDFTVPLCLTRSSCEFSYCSIRAASNC